MPAFGGNDASGASQSTGLFQLGRRYKPGLPLCLSHARFTLSGRRYRRPRDTPLVSPIGRQGTRKYWALTDSGWSAAETHAAGVSALASSPQPCSSALPFVAPRAACPTDQLRPRHAGRHGFLRGSRATSRVASYRYQDHLIGALMQRPPPGGSRWLGIVSDESLLALGNASCRTLPTGCVVWLHGTDSLEQLHHGEVQSWTDGTRPCPSFRIQRRLSCYGQQLDYVPPSTTESS